jgi:hypothetical protein
MSRDKEVYDIVFMGYKNQTAVDEAQTAVTKASKKYDRCDDKLQLWREEHTVPLSDGDKIILASLEAAVKDAKEERTDARAERDKMVADLDNRVAEMERARVAFDKREAQNNEEAPLKKRKTNHPDNVTVRGSEAPLENRQMSVIESQDSKEEMQVTECDVTVDRNTGEESEKGQFIDELSESC